ncbi:MAG TPA: cytochrome c, partial [Halioglobus sp.]
VSGFSAIGFTLCLCLDLLNSGRVFANPQLTDELSLSNGAQLYALYCSECHGRELTDRGDVLETNETDSALDYAEKIKKEHFEKSAEAAVGPEVDKWPEWAERPTPKEPEVPDEKTEVLKMIVAVIEEAHRPKPTSDMHGPGSNSRQENVARFDPQPGATNLADPESFYYGTTEDELFDSIAKGTGASMPGWRTELGSDEAIWDLVNYIRSFWDEAWLY